MVFGKSRLEFRLGLFVFAGLIILVSFILLIGNIKTWGSSYRVTILFNFVNGVKVGAPVRFAGVDVGEVRDIRFAFDNEAKQTRVEVVSIMKKSAAIPYNSQVWVNTLGLLGEKYIEIMPGDDYARLLKDNDTLSGNDPIAMHEIGALAKSVIDNVNEAINKITNGEGTVGRLMYDDTIHNELVLLLSETQELVKGAEGLVEDIRRNPWKLFWKTKERPSKK